MSSAASPARATGPITLEGKLRSSANSLKHGLTARHLRLSEEETPLFEEMRAELEAQIAPRGPLELQVFERLILASWNLRRAAILSASLDPLDDAQAGAFARTELYQRRLENSFYRSLKELRELQTERLTRDALLSDADSDETKAGALTVPLANWPRIRSAVLAEQATKQRITSESYRQLVDQMMTAPPGASFSVTRFD